MDMEFMDKIERALRQYVEQQHGGVVAKASRALGLSESGLLHKWLKPKGDKDRRDPSLSILGPRFDDIGVRVRFAWEAKEHAPPTVCEECLALQEQVKKLEIENTTLNNVIMMLSGKTAQTSEPHADTRGASSKQQLSLTSQHVAPSEEKKAS